MRRAKKIVQKLQKEHTLVHQADGSVKCTCGMLWSAEAWARHKDAYAKRFGENVCPRLACEKGETLKFSYPSTPLPRGGKKVA